MKCLIHKTKFRFNRCHPCIGEIHFQRGNVWCPSWWNEDSNNNGNDNKRGSIRGGVSCPSRNGNDDVPPPQPPPEPIPPQLESEGLFVGGYGRSWIWYLLPGLNLNRENWNIIQGIDSESIYSMRWINGKMYVASENEDKTGAVYVIEHWIPRKVCEKGRHYYCHWIWQHDGKVRSSFSWHNGEQEINSFLWGSDDGQTWSELALLEDPKNYRCKAWDSFKGHVYGAGYYRVEGAHQQGILIKQNGSRFVTVFSPLSNPLDGLKAFDDFMLIGGYYPGAIYYWDGTGEPRKVFENKDWWSIIRFAQVGDYYYAGGKGSGSAVILRSPDGLNWSAIKGLGDDQEVRGMTRWVAPDRKPKLVAVCGRSGGDHAWVYDPENEEWNTIDLPDGGGKYFSCAVSPV